MRYKLISGNIGSLFILSLFFVTVSGCKKFLDVDLDKSKVLVDEVFSSNENVTSAVNGLYQTFVEGSFGGGTTGISNLTSLSADEFTNILRTPQYVSFESNSLRPDDFFVTGLWRDGYKIIYQANDILEELEQSNSLSEQIKTHATGEALFMRAFAHFYLTNLFGDIPLLLTTDYKVTSTASRENRYNVLEQVVEDLQQSIDLLDSTYIRENKTRPNKSSAMAFLARVYLYQEKWTEANQAASNIIGSNLYSLPDDVNKVFNKNSPETIWQLASEKNFNTKEAYIIDGNNLSSGSCGLTPALLNAFEGGDNRRVNWIGTWQDNVSPLSLDYLFKYKAQYAAPPTSEFLIALRLAEIFLIRSEARARLSDIDGAVSDLNVIRERAGLATVEDAYGIVGQSELIDLIFNERRIELLGEWGHRWFDLKRSGRAETVLQSIKPDFSINDCLYPIPSVEFSWNPFLGDQNPGY